MARVGVACCRKTGRQVAKKEREWLGGKAVELQAGDPIPTDMGMGNKENVAMARRT